MELQQNQGVLLTRKDSLDLLSRVDRLPSLPCVLVDIRRVMDDPDSGILDLAGVIERDQSTSVMVLKFANSAIYNPNGRKYSSLNDAVARIGMEQAASIANAMSIMQGGIVSKDCCRSQRFWVHCFGVALMSRRLATIVNADFEVVHPENAFMVGLLHEVGRVALASNVDYCYFTDEVSLLTGAEACEYDVKHYGVSHCEAAGFIMKAWMFPSSLVDAVVHLYDGRSPVVKICRYADVLVNVHCASTGSFEGMAESVDAYINGVDVESIREVVGPRSPSGEVSASG